MEGRAGTEPWVAISLRLIGETNITSNVTIE